jgi:nitronate monooxygenase
MTDLLRSLGVDLPVLAAPMGGGPGTPALVGAAAGAGGLGFLAGGYKSVEALAGEIREIRANAGMFGVNLFAPNPVPVDPAAYAAYARAIRADGEAYGLDTTTVPVTEDDDRWAEKVDLLLADPVPVVSFTFGLPEREVIARLERAGSLTMQTVTSAAEARTATEAGVRALAVQCSRAGGHSGTLTPKRPPEDLALADLVESVRAASPLPVVAAGGIGTGEDVRRALAAGADAVAVGTVLIRCQESGATATHRDALADPARTRTVVTRCFTGRPARALSNDFVTRYDALAPSGYPALHHLTSPMRKAAAAAGDAERVHLWAGTGFRHATAEPARVILARLAASL